MVDAVEQRVETNMRLARQCASTYLKILNPADRDDVFSDALVGLWTAAKRWEAYDKVEDHWSWSTYVWGAMRREIIDGWRRIYGRERTSARRANIVKASLEFEFDSGTRLADIIHEIADSADPEHETIVRALLGEAFEKLTEREIWMLQAYYLVGLTYREIGEIDGVTESRVCQIVQRAIVRLRTLRATKEKMEIDAS